MTIEFSATRRLLLLGGGSLALASCTALPGDPGLALLGRRKRLSDFPPIPEWYTWPGVAVTEPIPGNARVAFSGVWNAPAPRSEGPVSIDFPAINPRIWRYFYLARNAFSVGGASTAWMGCPSFGECAIGWSRWGAPSYVASGPNQFKATSRFSQNSHDMSRQCQWALLYSP
jgi:hypothetical protein